MLTIKKSKGFTLIEIVIVLAIAALILAAVFIGVQGAQAARRDSQRKSDAARMIAAGESYASNNSGDISAMTAANVEGTLTDPTGTAYSAITTGNAGFITLVKGAASGANDPCSGAAVTNTRFFVVSVLLDDKSTKACYRNF